MPEVVFKIAASKDGLGQEPAWQVLVPNMDAIPAVGDDIIAGRNVERMSQIVGESYTRARVERLEWMIYADGGLRVGLVGDDDDEGVDEGVLSRVVVFCHWLR